MRSSKGSRSDTASGLALPPGEANNRGASGATLRVERARTAARQAAGEHPQLPAARPSTRSASPVAKPCGSASTPQATPATTSSIFATATRPAATLRRRVYRPGCRRPAGVVGTPVPAITTYCAGTPGVARLTDQPARRSAAAVDQPHQPGPWRHRRRRATLGHDRHPGLTSRPGTGPALATGGFRSRARPLAGARRTHIRAVFDSRRLPPGLYDLTVINPDGQRVTEAQRYLVERGSRNRSDPRHRRPAQPRSGRWRHLQRFAAEPGQPGYAVRPLRRRRARDGLQPAICSLACPCPISFSPVRSAGQPDGPTADAAGNTLSFGPTPDDGGLGRSDVPWVRLDGVNNSDGHNLARRLRFRPRGRWIRRGCRQAADLSRPQ
jgi:hypothetical protein